MWGFEKSCRLLLPEKEKTDILKMNYIDDVDVQVCNYVKDKIPYIKSNSYVLGDEIYLLELIYTSLDEMRIFGDDISNFVKKLFLDVEINLCNDDIFEYSCNVEYSINMNDEVIVDSGVINCYNMPKSLYEYSVYAICHEHVHALKETNYNEYQDAFRFGETLPIFFELLMFEPNSDLKIMLMRERLFNLYMNKREYDIANKLLKKNTIVSFNGNNLYQQRSVYEYARSKCGCYLNSFYYAIILYKMYKENPSKILLLVSSVLKKEKTTLEILYELNLYGDIRGEVFEREVNKIRRLVK